MYYFFIGPVLLPVTPGSMETSKNGNNETVNLINESEINILKEPGLDTISFEALFPQGNSYPFALYSLAGLDALAFTEYFNLLRTKKIPFPFVVAKMKQGTILPVGYSYMVASIENMRIIEDASDGTDVKVRLELKQYKQYSTRKIKKISESGDTITYTLDPVNGVSYASEIKKLASSITAKIGVSFPTFQSKA